jgi:23S rRNA pseudouridine1911/1915/1917 synthase
MTPPPPQKRHEFQHAPDWEGVRIKALLQRLLPGLSGRAAQEIISNGLVTINGGDPVTDFATVVPAGATLVVDLRHGTRGHGERRRPPLAQRVRVVHDDDFLVVISKAAGVLTAPVPDAIAPAHSDGPPVVEALKHYWRSRGLPEVNPHVVQRLDIETSGLMVLAKDGETAAALQEQLQPPRRLERVYTAIAAGHFTVPEGIWKSQLGRGPSGLRHSVGDHNRQDGLPEDAQYAETHYRVVEKLGKASLLELRLATGRTHQIRIHCAEAGHPLMGDDLYWRLADMAFSRFRKREWRPYTPENPAMEAFRLFEAGATEPLAPGHRPRRIMLHSMEIAFDHPATGERLAFHDDVPPDFATYRRTLTPG